MGHGKETPRQKMIGMMYLVLMALLALNVSKEVLDAFAILDSGLINTMKTLDATNHEIMDEFQAQATTNPEKVGEWKDKAERVQNEANKIYDFIQETKVALVKESEGENAEAIGENNEIDLQKVDGKDNTDVPSRLMVGDNNKKAANDLKKALNAYKKMLTTEIVTAESAEAVRQSINSSLNAEDLKTKQSGKIEWEHHNFVDRPLAGVLTILSGIQINVRNAESDALRYLYAQIDAGSFKFNKLIATVIPNSNYIVRGNPFKAEVFMAATDTTAVPTIWVAQNSKPYNTSVDENGDTIYSKRSDIEYKKLDVTAGSGRGVYLEPKPSIGQKTWGGIIEIQGPGGNSITRAFKHEYTVAEGSVVVSPTKMNVFYIGVDNPVDVSVAGVQPDKIDISVTNGSKRARGNSYIIRPRRPGNSWVVVYADVEGKRSEVGRKEFRVKTVPDPVAVVNNQEGGVINKSLLLNQIGVVAKMKDFDFDIKYTVSEFTVAAIVNGFYRRKESRSYRFTKEQKALISGLSTGNSVFIEDIKATGPDGERKLGMIKFKLK